MQHFLAAKVYDIRLTGGGDFEILPLSARGHADAGIYTAATVPSIIAKELTLL